MSISNKRQCQRLLILSEGFPPDSGGVATSTQRLARGFAEAGLHTTVLTYQRGKVTDLNPAISESEIDGIRTVRLGPFFKSAGGDRDLEINAKHRALLRRRFVDNAVRLISEGKDRPNAILSMYLLNAGFIGTHMAAMLGVPHIVGVRGNDIGRNVFDPASLYATRFVLERAARIACVNRHLQTRMLNVFPDLSERSIIINNSVAPLSVTNQEASRQQLLKETGWPPNSVICCFIGSFREKKGCVEIVEAFQAIAKKRQGMPIRLLLISPPLGSTERVVIGDDLDMLLTDRIVWRTAVVDRDQVRAVASAADLLLQPSLEDGMANALLEGMSIGLCPIVSPLFGDVVREGEGLVLEQVTGLHIASAVEKLCDRDIRERLGAGALKRSLDFRPELETGAYLRLFDSTLGDTVQFKGFEP